MGVQEKGDTVFDMELSHNITGIQHVNLKWQWRWRQNKSRSDVSDTLKNSSTFALRWTPCWMIGENSWCFTLVLLRVQCTVCIAHVTITASATVVRTFLPICPTKIQGLWTIVFLLCDVVCLKVDLACVLYMNSFYIVHTFLVWNQLNFRNETSIKSVVQFSTLMPTIQLILNLRVNLIREIALLPFTVGSAYSKLRKPLFHFSFFASHLFICFSDGYFSERSTLC